MKNTGQCHKCESRKIIRIPSPKFNSGTGINTIPVGWLKTGQVRITRYLCCRCGYSEEWVDSKEDIKKIEESYDNHELDDYV